MQISVSATVGVEGGPTMSVSTSLDPATYVVSQLVVGPSKKPADGKPDPNPEGEEPGDGKEPGPKDSTPAGAGSVELLPQGGSVALLAMSATDPAGKPADVRATLVGASAKKAEVSFVGSFLLANESALSGLVVGGPRAVEIEAKAGVVVNILAARGNTA